MDDSNYRLNFDEGKKNEINQDSKKGHRKISRIAKLGWEMLNGKMLNEKVEKIALRCL